MAKTLHKAIAAADAAPAVGAYSQAVEVDESRRWLHISGQIGMAKDGSVPADAESQCRLAWQNLLAQLRAAGMGPEHLVKVTSYLVDAAHLPHLRQARDAVLADALPASTAVIVAGLAHPSWLVEIEAVAAG